MFKQLPPNINSPELLGSKAYRRFPLGVAGKPYAITPAGIELYTTEPNAITAPMPIRTDGEIRTIAQIQASSSISILPN